MSLRCFLVVTAVVVFPHVWQAPVIAQSEPPDTSTQTPLPPTKPDVIDILASPKETRVEASAPALSDIKIPNFASCPIAELRHTVRELAHLKVAVDQSHLSELLDKIGAKTVEAARTTPNLISDETVILGKGPTATQQNFSFLVLQHMVDAKSVVFDEYRVDLKNGEKMETDFAKIAPTNSHTPSSPAVDLPAPVLSVRPPQSRTPTLSQGFVSQWLYFYPLNRLDSEFRYLGEQDMDGHHTLVVAFAQKPGYVRLPATFESEDKKLPIFMQGVAWVDSIDFRIIRLRTELLLPPPGMRLRQLASDVQFAEIRLAQVPSPLWLPRQVVTSATIGPLSLHEKHIYANYRIFRANSKIVSKP